MSLRDQLLKAGLTDQKTVAKANRKLKKSRKTSQAQRDSKAEVRRKDERAAKAAAKQRRREAAAERNRLLVIQEAQAKQRLLRKVIRSYAVPQKEGPVSFWHLAPDRKTLLRLRLPESWALDLRSGRMAVAWTGPNTALFEVVILPQHAALRVAATDASRLLFFNTAPPPDDDPAETLYGSHGEASTPAVPALPAGHVYTPPRIRL